jgi:hypothetical protein
MAAEDPLTRNIWRTLRAFASSAAREPLLHFFAAALVLFVAYSAFHGRERVSSGTSIVISEGRVNQIAGSFRLLAGRMPSRAELEALVNDFVDEEIDYREAIAMGLDADDTIVRRRMRQKLEFLAEDADASEEPSDAELTTWLHQHAADYRVPERISFRQVLASHDTRGARTAADATALRDKLNAGGDPEALGDASMLPTVLPLTTHEGVTSLFGEAFAAQVFEHPACEDWFGPVSSPLGAHAVQILSREPARDPAFGDVRDRLRSDWIEAKRLAKREAFQATLRKRYRVTVDWPRAYGN